MNKANFLNFDDDRALASDERVQEAAALRANAPPIPGSTLEELERYAILKTIESVDGSTSRAAEVLGISVRKIQYKLQEYGARSPARSVRATVARAQRGE
jgi:DNA-binding NtrC family response regulator